MSWSVEEILDDIATDISDVLWGVVEGLGDMFNAILQAVPVPEFLDTLPVYISAMPSDVLYWLSFFEFSAGLSMIAGAVTARILLGLLPWVGSAFR